ncbi:MAG: metalloregulator ArsR/SmtB family transcription factor [Balneolaceae bacterium]
MNKQYCIRQVADLNQINRCIQTLENVNESIVKLSGILKLAGNDVRLKILYLLDREEHLCPCDISDILEMSIPAVSQHLRKLKDAGIVDTTRNGQVIFYSLNTPYRTILQSSFKQIKENKLLEVLAA